MTRAQDILSVVQQSINKDRFREQHWEGSFEDYLELVTTNPRIARNAFQRIYDMINYFGEDRYTWMREELVRYKFFDDPFDEGADAIYGLDRPPDESGRFLQVSGTPLWYGAPDSVTARSRWIVQKYHRPAFEKRAGVLFRTG